MGQRVGEAACSLQRSQVCKDPEKSAPGKGTEVAEGTAGVRGGNQLSSGHCPPAAPRSVLW